jgi:hypothetical protein
VPFAFGPSVRGSAQVAPVRRRRGLALLHSPLRTSQRCKDLGVAEVTPAGRGPRRVIALARAGALAIMLALRVTVPSSMARAAAPGASTHAAAKPGSAAHAAAASEGTHETVLRGEVVENGCFVIGARRGEAHLSCALTCARAGENLGLLDDESKTLFLVVQDLTAGPQPNPLLDYLTQRVEVRGTTVERGGISAIVVHQVKSLNPPPVKH